MARHACRGGFRAGACIGNNEKARLAAGFVYNWCPGEDSNLHGFTR